MKIVTKTDGGKVRKTNQDSYASGEFFGEVAWAVVCDGMGGANGGNVASATAVKIISDHISSGFREGMRDKSIQTMLQSAVFAANVSVYDMSRSVETLKGMGTTVVICLIANSTAHIVHAGDSRAYLYHGGKLEQITRDHSIVQTMLESGQLTPEEARFHPKKNVITRALGVGETVDVDYNEIPLKQGDMILLCSDGLTNYVDVARVTKTIKESDFTEYADKLVDIANDNGGGDNITVVAMAE